MWNANLLRGCCSLVLLALLLAPVGAHAQSGFILTAPGTSRASCTAITSPVTNQTWCADGTGAPSTYLWKVWNGTTYITVGGGGGGGGGVCGMSGFVTIAGTDTTATVTFGTPTPDTSYIVAVTTTPSLGMPPGVLAWFRNKTVNGFTVEITAAPGAGNSVDVDWIVTFSGGPATCGGAGITGSGTTNTIPLWTSSTTLGNSIVSQTSNTLTVSAGSSVTQTIRASSAATGNGALLTVKGGDAVSAGDGGAVIVEGGLPNGTHGGGAAEIAGRAGTPGGSVTILAGQSTTGTGGGVIITSGVSLSGAGGDVNIGGGAGTTTVGRVIMQGLTYPSVDGTSGHVMTTNGAGVLSLAALPSTRRNCSIIIGADNGPVLVNADIGPQGQQCQIPADATVIEVGVAADGGTPSALPRKHTNAAVNTNLLSGALSTAASGGYACSNTGGTLSIDGITTCTNTLTTTAIGAGNWLELISGTAGGVAKRMSISITYTIP